MLIIRRRRRRLNREYVSADIEGTDEPRSVTDILGDIVAGPAAVANLATATARIVRDVVQAVGPLAGTAASLARSIAAVPFPSPQTDWRGDPSEVPRIERSPADAVDANNNPVAGRAPRTNDRVEMYRPRQLP